MAQRKLSKQEEKTYQEWLELRARINSQTEPIREEGEVAKRKRIRDLISPGNEEQFCLYYFPHYCQAAFGWFHKQAFEDIRAEDSFNIWEWAREHAKSVFANVFTPALMIARGTLTGMILASENELKAKVLIKDIEAELRDNRRLINDFGEMNVMGTWQQAHFSIKGGAGFWSFGLGQNPAGVRQGEKRPNLGVVDDADNKKKYRNQKRLKEDLDWILGEFLGCLSIKGKTFIYANNRVCKDGLTAHMVGDVDESDPKREGVNHIKVFATEDPKTHALLMPEEGGIPAWKENYTVAHIKKRMQVMGYRNAMRQFFHKHIEDGNIFQPEHIKWTEILPLDKYEQLITYCDPSFKDTKKSDFKAIVLMGKTGKYFDVLEAWVRQDSVSNMVKAHYDIHEHIEEGRIPMVHEEDGFALREVLCRHYIEANMLQDILLEEYELEAEAREYNLRVRPDKRKKPDKFGRIENLEPLFARGLVRFNEKLKKEVDFQTLKDQFLAFPNDHDDGPDAVEGAIYLLNRRTKARKTTARSGNYKRNSKRAA